jgi:hypothetical protein
MTHFGSPTELPLSCISGEQVYKYKNVEDLTVDFKLHLTDLHGVPDDTDEAEV